MMFSDTHYIHEHNLLWLCIVMHNYVCGGCNIESKVFYNGWENNRVYGLILYAFLAYTAT